MHTLRNVLPFMVLASACAIAREADKPGADRGLRFNSPGVLDLAERSLQVADGHPVPVTAMSDADAQMILAAPAIGEESLALAFSDDVFGCSKPSRKCSAEGERKLLEAAGATAKRDGKRLTVMSASGASAAFVDWVMATTSSADGDQETHWYLGRMAGSGYARVEVEFGHDAPGNFLVNLQSGKVAFVHNAADLAVPSPDGMHLLTWNSLNSPFSLRVAALDAAGPRLALQCQAPEGKQRLTPVFKGWHDAGSFDLVIEVGEQGKAMPRLALRATQGRGSGGLAVSDPARFAAIGLACTN